MAEKQTCIAKITRARWVLGCKERLPIHPTGFYWIFLKQAGDWVGSRVMNGFRQSIWWVIPLKYGLFLFSSTLNDAKRVVEYSFKLFEYQRLPEYLRKRDSSIQDVMLDFFALVGGGSQSKICGAEEANHWHNIRIYSRIFILHPVPTTRPFFSKMLLCSRINQHYTSKFWKYGQSPQNCNSEAELQRSTKVGSGIKDSLLLFSVKFRKVSVKGN